MLNVEHGFLEHVADVGVVERIDGPAPDPLAHDESEMSQKSQLMGNG